MKTCNVRLVPLDGREADRLREIGGPIYIADTKPGFPCRQCLEDAAVGDELILTSHDPFGTASPYRSASPIFLHRHPCGEPSTQDELPLQLTGRQLSVRSFDQAEMMIDAAVVAGKDLAQTLDRLFADSNSDTIHVHNAERGCWATKVIRA